METLEKVTCSYNRDYFHNIENGYTIAEYQPTGTFRKEDTITAKGNNMPRQKGILFDLVGNWTNEADKNRTTLAVKKVHFSVLNSTEKIISYLSSGMFKGIGTETAKLIVEKFGSESVEIIENTPDRMLEIKGITEKKIAEISSSYSKKIKIKEIVKYFGDVKITEKRAHKIHDKFGEKSIEVMENNIYRLTEIKGFGFKTIDEMADKLGRPLNTSERVLCASTYLLKENMKNGHLYMELESFLSDLNRLLVPEGRSYKMAKDESREITLSLCSEKKLIYNQGSIYSKTCFMLETLSAKNLTERLLLPKTPINTFIYDISDISLSLEQEKAVLSALENNISIITGFPGTGKTTVLKSLLYNIAAFFPKFKVCLVAPTGKASKRMEESTNNPASTVHSAFNLFPTEWEISESKSQSGVNADVIIIDEFSMVDMWLFYEILNRAKPTAKIVLVGDPFQLPSVGAGNVFYELMQTNLIPTTNLTKIYRSAEGSSIKKNVMKIYNGDTELIFDNSFRLFPSSTEEEALEKIISYINEYWNSVEISQK